MNYEFKKSPRATLAKMLEQKIYFTLILISILSILEAFVHYGFGVKWPEKMDRVRVKKSKWNSALKNSNF